MDRSEFKKYLIDTKKLLDEYTGDYTLEDIMEIADNMGDTIDSYLDIKYNSLYEIEEPNEINDIISKLKAEPVFNHLDRYDRIYTNILKSYRNFLKNNNNMKFTEAKEFLNNKGYMLVEWMSEPDAYPPDERDTEGYESNAYNAAKEELETLLDKFKTELSEKFPGIDFGVYEIKQDDSGEFDYDEEGRTYRETLECSFWMSVPLKYLNLTKEGAEDNKLLDDTLTKFYLKYVKPLDDSVIDFDIKRGTDSEIDRDDNTLATFYLYYGSYDYAE